MPRSHAFAGGRSFSFRSVISASMPHPEGAKSFDTCAWNAGIAAASSPSDTTVLRFFTAMRMLLAMVPYPSSQHGPPGTGSGWDAESNTHEHASSDELCMDDSSTIRVFVIPVCGTLPADDGRFVE